MREIKFKAKRLDNGEWVEGGYFKSFVCHYISSEEVNNRGKSYVEYQIDSETLCQFTGLYDKNGKKIWEGDIVKYKDEAGYPTYDVFMNAGVIEYDNGQFYVTERNCVDMVDLISGNTMECEIIGNIFDNKELLEVEE